MAAPKRQDGTEQRDAAPIAPARAQAHAGETSLRPDTRPDTHAATAPASSGASLLTLSVAAASFLAGAAFAVWLVPEHLRLVAAGSALAVAGLAIGLAGVLQGERGAHRRAMAQANARLAALDAERGLLTAETERLRDEIWRLKESDGRLRDVLDTLGDVVTRWRAGGEIVYANDAAERLLPAGWAPTLPAEAQAEQGGEAEASRDIEVETAAGPRWFARRDVPVRDGRSGEPLIQTILRDVTDRRRIEDALLAACTQAETANASKSRFLATVSHEIRTPLNGILGMTGLLADTRLTAEQASYVEAVRASGEILLLLINEVLDLSRIEAGRLDLAPEEIALAPLAESVVELLSPRAQSKGLEIGCYISPEMPARLVADPTRLRQILFNLAGNGLKFTEQGGVEVSIEPVAEQAGAAPRRFAITVRDTGIGFAPQEAERLFEEFEQVDHGPARRFDGAGLGLAISRRLARLMGGDVTARSAPGEGATFRVELPLEIAASAQQAVPTPETEAPRALAGARIALVSTSRIEMPLIARALAAQGAAAVLLAPGNEAGDDALLAADLVLLDPLAVTDAGAWLASARAAGLAAPAGVLLTPSERDRLPRLREAGFGGYLIRPVRAASLRELCATLLGRDSGLNSGLSSRLSPWDRPEPRALSEAEAAERDGPHSARPLRVLVADDNDINRMLSEALLRKLGHEPVVVADGAAALAAAADGSCDMLLMDLHMPGIDGIAAIRRFRQMEQAGGWPRAPVYVVTADVTPDAEQAALAAGADAVLSKPLDPDLLRRRIVRRLPETPLPGAD
ncbi:hybrid sensor histidine kinase/response regulator [Stappia sp. TSB10GB4]|uniref:hybrid sensor histidine kinase/response regulator n=1 Tax=Stappia sp. TSB10GB4 TaxID=2003584 RepID=UPI0016465A3B|nr:ATP-binding protein [Stappia sp. TSB10GB4]